MPYVTLDELKDFLGVTTGDHDNQLRAAIAAAEAMADAFMGRSLLSQQVTESVRPTDAPTIYPRRTPITAVASCLVDGTSVDVTHSDIWVRRSNGAYFARSQVITLTYTGGLAAAPADVKTAIMITAQAVFDAGDLDANLLAEGGNFGGSYQPGGPGSLPRAAQTILAPYRRSWMHQ
jgi:hypothetical protein